MNLSGSVKKLVDQNLMYFKTYWALILYASFIVSPSLMFYLSKGIFTFFLPLFFISQLQIFILIASLIKNKKTYYLITFPFFLIALFQWGHFSLFNHEVTEGAFAAILATNFKEAIEFMLAMPSYSYVLFLILTVFCSFLYWSTPTTFKDNKSVILSSLFILFFTYSIKLVSSRSFSTATEDVFLSSQPLKTVISLHRGSSLLNDFRDRVLLQKPLDVEFAKYRDGNETHILVIGESSRRRNWSYYGYPRLTNEFTAKVTTPSPYIFNDVVSAANSTIASLAYTLTYSKGEKITTIMDVASKAGYKTFWISNQSQYGVYDNPTSLLAERADKRTFITASGHDDLTVKELKKILPDPSSKKLIIIHLMGSHAHYHHRYPREFSFFDDCDVQYLYKIEKCGPINEYDNSIRFTDFVLSEFLTEIKKSVKSYSLLYFSDHGEQLFDHNQLAGHGGVDITRAEVEIPMLIWMSDDLIKQMDHQIKSVTKKEISLWNFFPSYLYLLGINVSLEDKNNFFTDDINEERFVYNPQMNKVFYKEIK